MPPKAAWGIKMSDTEKLMHDFSENYMEKVFYFCLRKCGNDHDAEDLTQDIALAVISELRRGVVPESFPAWVWQIARNLYSKWADRKHKRSNFEVNTDISDLELSDDTSPENEYIRKEDLSSLRRELAFISSEYRNVVVAYYIEDMSVGMIAERLSLPVGTVKSKLFRARNILKEGMNMAREFGALSYNPEDIAIINSGGFGYYGEPWTILDHKLNKNILIAAYRTPSTAEELAVELGVALPYMEDELNFLVKSTLMKKNGNKYETSFFIVSTAAQDRIYLHLSQIAPKLTKAIADAIEYRTERLNENSYKWHGGYQAYDDMKWMLLMREVDRIGRGIGAKTEPSKRPHGGHWNILGLEMRASEVKRPDFVGQHGGNNDIDFGQFKFYYKEINRQTPDQLNDKESTALLAVVNSNYKSISAEALEKLAKYGYIEKAKKGYVPRLAVLYGDPADGLSDEQKAEYDRLVSVARDIAKEHYDFCREVICGEIPDFMKDNTNQINFACNTVKALREGVFAEAISNGYLTYNGGENEARDRMLGAFIVVDK